LLNRIVQISTNSDSIILDFFAGSGSTADAIMQLNSEDGGNRKFILVQLPEEIDKKKNKAAYDFVSNELKAEPTIFEITKERLLRAAKKVNESLDTKNDSLKAQIVKLETELQTEETIEEINNLKEQIAKNEALKTNNTFKIFETTPIWEDYNFDAKELDDQFKLFDESKLTEDDIKALLTTWKTYDGIPLTQELKVVDLDAYSAYYGNGKLYLMHKGFTTENLKNILEKIDSDKSFDPKTVVAFGYHFESKNLRELSENLRNYKNKKGSDENISFITRY
jgi:adenine-specific DNA-methyltransferase